jgi:hypothetical protein
MGQRDSHPIRERDTGIAFGRLDLLVVTPGSLVPHCRVVARVAIAN